MHKPVHSRLTKQWERNSGGSGAWGKGGFVKCTSPGGEITSHPVKPKHTPNSRNWLLLAAWRFRCLLKETSLCVLFWAMVKACTRCQGCKQKERGHIANAFFAPLFISAFLCLHPLSLTEGKWFDLSHLPSLSTTPTEENQSLYYSGHTAAPA